MMNKTILAHDSVLLEMAILKERNEEMRLLRDELDESHEEWTKPIKKIKSKRSQLEVDPHHQGHKGHSRPADSKRKILDMRRRLQKFVTVGSLAEIEKNKH